MGHPQIENKTAFILETLFLMDEDQRPLVVPIVKATFTIGADGRCAAAETQIPLQSGGEYWGDGPEASSLKYEPEVAFTKPATDVVMIGHAYADRRDTRQMQVSLRVGSLAKDVAVHGDRVWFKSGGSISFSRTLPFEKIPLTYERAYGGWDRSHPDPLQHAFEPRNPVGTGFRGASELADGLRLPNLEDPRAPSRASPTSRRPPDSVLSRPSGNRARSWRAPSTKRGSNRARRFCPRTSAGVI